MLRDCLRGRGRNVENGVVCQALIGIAAGDGDGVYEQVTVGGLAFHISNCSVVGITSL